MSSRARSVLPFFLACQRSHAEHPCLNCPGWPLLPSFHRRMINFAASARRSCGARDTGDADDLTSLKDDMVAFILGHGMSRFQGYVTEDVHSVMWDPRDNPESWKDFVELAKKAGSAFLSMDEEVLQRDEIDYLIQPCSANCPATKTS